MENSERELREKWNSINYYSGGSLQLSIDHPLEWHVRYASPEQKSIVIVSDNPVNNIASSKSIEAACNERKDGRYAISFTLVNRSQEDVFITMSGDIIEFSRVERADAALKRVVKRYAAWLKLLDHKHSAMMGDNAQKGLIGELLFLKEIIEAGMNPADAVAGWVGPDGADQDFVYETGWHEVKTTGASSASVSISSIEQLDCNDSGELVVFRIDKCAPGQPGAVTLFKMVHTVFEMLSADTGAFDNFVNKLGAAGYIDMKEYDKQTYVCSDKKTYWVNETFPKLSRNNVAEEIINAEYQISLSGLGEWKK